MRGWTTASYNAKGNTPSLKDEFITLSTHSASPSQAVLINQAGQGSNKQADGFIIQRILSTSSVFTGWKEYQETVLTDAMGALLMWIPSHGKSQQFYPQSAYQTYHRGHACVPLDWLAGSDGGDAEPHRTVLLVNSVRMQWWQRRALFCNLYHRVGPLMGPSLYETQIIYFSEEHWY